MTDHWLSGKSVEVDRVDGDREPGRIIDVEETPGQTRVIVETPQGEVNTASERVEVVR